MKKITMTVYEIHYVEQHIQTPDLSSDLFNCLNATNTARDRLMLLSHDEANKDSDFITTFTSSNGFLFGSFARLTEREESSVPKTALDKKTVSLNEMIAESRDNSVGSIKISSFFCIYKTFLVITNKKQTLKPLENYVNWFLEQKGINDGRISFIPKKNTATVLPIHDIKSVQINDGYINAIDEIKSQSMHLKESILKKLMDVKGIKDFDEENLVSAILTLKFKQKNIKKEKALDTALKIIDDDNIIIIGKNGRRIRGSQYLVSVVRKIEELKDDIFNEQEIETEMRKILKDIESGKVVS